MASEIQVTDIARWLQNSKDAGRSTLLFLGARTGGLFRSKTLYGTVQYFSSRAFNNMSRIEQFAECCRILLEEDLSRSEIDTILTASLQGLQITETDVSLAELVKRGFFETIISTNIDDLLTKAFVQVGMEEFNDFQVFNPRQSSVENIESPQQRQFCRLIKVFGDLASGEYYIRNDFYLEKQKRLKAYLESTLKNDVLMLGYDPFWDRAIDAIFPLEGQELWYVNEDEKKEPFLRLLRNRRGKYIVGGEGNYDHFIQALHWHLVGERPLSDQFLEKLPTKFPYPFMLPSASQGKQSTDHPPFQQHPPQKTSPAQQRKYVFIGYSHQDRRYLEQLQTHLARYEREQLVDVWDDTKILPGVDWRKELQKALDHTRVAILLVSADFLASSFIAEDVLPPLLRAAEAGGAIILSIIVNYCAIEGTSLEQYQPFNDPSEPLAIKKTGDKHKVWAGLVRYVTTLVNVGAKVVSIPEDVRSLPLRIASVRQYLTEAGFNCSAQSNPLTRGFLVLARTSVWQERFPRGLYVRTLFDSSLDQENVGQIHLEAKAYSDHALVVIDQQPKLSGWMAIGGYRTEEKDRFVILPIDESLIKEGLALNKEYHYLNLYINKHLGKDFDPYDVRYPVADAVNFFGHESLTDEMVHALKLGQSLGLFGLQKIGKSSVLKRIQMKAEFPVAYVYLSKGDSLDGVYERILEGWSIDIRKKFPNLQWYSPQILLKSNSKKIFDSSTKELLKLLVTVTSTPLLAIFFDEIENIVPYKDGDEVALQRYIKLMDSLRGLQQETNYLSLLVAGVHPHIARRNYFWGNQKNPMHQVISERILASFGSGRLCLYDT